jgi:hypothetical protein
MNIKNLILTILLVVQIVLIAFLYRPAEINNAPDVELFENLAFEKLEKIIITDDQSKELVLVKEKNWVIEPEKFPASQEKLDTVIAKIKALKSNRLVSKTKSSLNRLKVGEQIFSRRVNMTGKDFSETLYLGTAPIYKSIHVRKEGEQNVFLAKDLSAWELPADPDSWWQKKYLTLTPGEIIEIEVVNSAGKIHLVKDKENWKNKEEKAGNLDPSAVDSFLSEIAEIQISKYLTKDETPQEIKNPAGEIKLKSKTKSIKLSISAKDEKNSEYTVKSSTLAFAGICSENELKDFLSKTISDFPKVPEKKEGDFPVKK